MFDKFLIKKALDIDCLNAAEEGKLSFISFTSP